MGSGTMSENDVHFIKYMLYVMLSQHSFLKKLIGWASVTIRSSGVSGVHL